jgi:hypothetical protein
MRTYDPADGICYVHLAQDPVAPPSADDLCHRLPAGYANASLGARLVFPARPTLVLLPGGPTETDAPAPAPLALRRAR